MTIGNMHPLLRMYLRSKLGGLGGLFKHTIESFPLDPKPVVPVRAIFVVWDFGNLELGGDGTQQFGVIASEEWTQEDQARTTALIKRFMEEFYAEARRNG